MQSYQSLMFMIQNLIFLILYFVLDDLRFLSIFTIYSIVEIEKEIKRLST